MEENKKEIDFPNWNPVHVCILKLSDNSRVVLRMKRSEAKAFSESKLSSLFVSDWQSATQKKTS